MPSSRRYKENDRDRDREREHTRSRTTDRTPAEVEKERYLEKERAERYKERGERYREPRDSTRTRHRIESDSEGIANVDRPNAHRRQRAEDWTTHRRHHPEQPPAHVPSVSWFALYLATSRFIDVRRLVDMVKQHNHTPPMILNNGVTHSHQGGQQSDNPSPAPRVMLVYLPPKPSSHIVYIMKDVCLFPNLPVPSPGVILKSLLEEYVVFLHVPCERRLKYPQHRAAPAQSGDGNVSNSTRDKTSCEAPAGPRDDIKEVCEHAYLQSLVNLPVAEQICISSTVDPSQY